MREEKTSMTLKEKELLNKYAESEGISESEALKRAFLQSIKKRFHVDLEGAVSRLWVRK